MPASRCHPTGLELDQHAWLLSYPSVHPSGVATSSPVGQDEQIQKFRSLVNPQGHFFKNPNQSPRGQSKHVQRICLALLLFGPAG